MENLPLVLQLALTVASLCIILLTVCLVPLLFQLRNALIKMAAELDETKAEVDGLLAESRELVRHVNTLTGNLNSRVADAGELVDQVRGFTARTGQIADGIGTMVEIPLLSLFRKAGLLRIGATTFFHALFHPKANHNQAKEQ
ncbi:MAG: DUF948 domain-containing protein [Victivallales bacterium]|nr:DUF948 domain-containing protein [Victivallales bacterium]